jgi:1-phosphofructokinase family hexose kinase
MIYTVTLNPAVDRELGVPSIEFDTVLRATHCRIDWGGKGFNVSRMLKSLGATATAIGFAAGKSGEMLRDGLEALGIPTDFVWVDGETRTNVSIVAKEPFHYLKVNEPGPNIRPDQSAQMLDRIRRLAKCGDWWVLSGSLPPGVSSNMYAEIIGELRVVGANAILDTEGEPLRLGCAERPFLVKPNHIEAHKLTNLPTNSFEEAIQTAQAILTMGPEQVVISMGEMGAVLTNRQGAWEVCGSRLQARNPIGAGDCLVGGLVWGLSEGLEMVDALRWGVACGAAAASLSGTAVGTREMVETLVKVVRVLQRV